jgi:uncharacterized membrane protein
LETCVPNKTSETIVELGRLNALSDGVYAIALTLLVLDIRIPENTSGSDLSASLVALAPKLLVYLISFIAIGGAWGSHQRMLSQIRRGDGLLVWFNLLSLLFVTLLPASAALLGRFPREFIAIVCFAADVILIQLTALWLWRHASKYGLLDASLDPRVVRSVGRRLILSAVSFGLSVALVVLNTNLVYLGWIGLFVLLFTTDWLSWQQVTRTTQVAIPLDGAARGQLEVLHGKGHLNILSDGTDDALVQGTCRGNVNTHVTREGDLLKTRLTSRSGEGFLNWRYPWAWEMPVLDWNLSLNPTIPLALRIEKGMGEIDLDFTRTHLTDLRLEMGEGSINLRLPANAGQTTVHIQAGTPSVVVHVPTGVAARIHVFKGLGDFDIDLTRFPLVEDGKTYCSSDYDTATNRVNIHLELGLSSVRII